MSEDEYVEMMVQVMDKVAERSEHCQRGLLEIFPERQIGFAIVAPDCINMAFMMFPHPTAIYDFILN